MLSEEKSSETQVRDTGEVPDEIKIIEARVSNTVCELSFFQIIHRTERIYLQSRKNEMFALGCHVRNHKIVLDFEFRDQKFLFILLVAKLCTCSGNHGSFV